VSRLCPDLLGSPREGREERRIEGGKEVAWNPKIYDRSLPLTKTEISTVVYTLLHYLFFSELYSLFVSNTTT